MSLSCAGGVARVRSLIRSHRPSVRPSASRTRPSMARTRSNEGRVATAAPRAFPTDDWQASRRSRYPHGRCTNASQNLAVVVHLRPILASAARRCGRLVLSIDESYVWRDSPPGHGDRDASERAEVKREKGGRERFQRNCPRIISFALLLPPFLLLLALHSILYAVPFFPHSRNPPVVPRLQIVENERGVRGRASCLARCDSRR